MWLLVASRSFQEAQMLVRGPHRFCAVIHLLYGGCWNAAPAALAMLAATAFLS